MLRIEEAGGCSLSKGRKQRTQDTEREKSQREAMEAATERDGAKHRNKNGDLRGLVMPWWEKRSPGQ